MSDGQPLSVLLVRLGSVPFVHASVGVGCHMIDYTFVTQLAQVELLLFAPVPILEHDPTVTIAFRDLPMAYIAE